MPLPSRLKEGLTHRFPIGSVLWAIQLLDTTLMVEKLRYRLKMRGALQSLYKRTAYERTLRALDRAFLADLTEQINYGDTLLAVLGDHGEFVDRRTDTVNEQLERHRLRSHGFHVYEYLTRVPFLLSGAGVSARPRTVDVLSNQTDVVPTLLSTLGVDCHSDQFDGRDLLHSGNAENHCKRPIFLEAVGNRQLRREQYLRGVRHGEWKLVEAPWMPSFEEELYNLEQDPLERHNLHEQRADVVEQLKPLVARHFASDGETLAARDDDHTRMPDEERLIVEDRLRTLGYID
jgi:arylsulfatase A-like enzyme